MMSITRYNEQEVRPCAKDLCTLLQTIDKRSTFKSLKKKYSLPKYCEVAKIKIEKKPNNTNNVNNTNVSNNTNLSSNTISSNTANNNNIHTNLNN